MNRLCIRKWRFAATFAGIVGLAASVGCGGGSRMTGLVGSNGGNGQSSGTPGGVSVANPSGGSTGTGNTSGGSVGLNQGVATALFHVDVPSGQVSITGLAGGSRKAGRAVFSGTAVTFSSSNLLNQPGDVGIRSLNVSLNNQWGQLIGATGNLRVLFGPIMNTSNTSTDLRPYTSVTTFAGAPGPPQSLDGYVTNARFDMPFSLAASSDGTIVYVTERNTVRKITGRNVSTLAGRDGVTGHDDGAGVGAKFNIPASLAVAHDGSIIVADSGNNLIRRITSDGLVTTISGSLGPGNNDGPGNTATFYGPQGVAADSNNNIYVSEAKGDRIRKIAYTSGDARLASSYTVTTIAGTGSPGGADGLGPTTAIGPHATFNAPVAIALDSTTSPTALYVADYGNNTIRRVSIANGETVTIAGTGIAGETDGSGLTATFSGPAGIAIYNGNLFITDFGGNRVREMALASGAAPNSPSSWFVSSLAGSGTAGATDGTGMGAAFNKPLGLTLDNAGNLYVVDSGNNTIRRVAFPAGLISTGTPNTSVSTTSPVVLSNPDGFVPQTGTGKAVPYITYTGPLASNSSSSPKPWNFLVPSGITSFEFTLTVEATTSTLAPPEASTGIGSSTNVVRTLAGATDGTAGLLNGTVIAARFNGPQDVVVGPNGEVYVLDSANHAIRRIGTNGLVTVVAGGTGAGNLDGTGIVAQFSNPTGLAIGQDGSLYVADTGNNIIRVVTLSTGDGTSPTDWNVTTIVGTGVQGNGNGQGNMATLDAPTGIAVDTTTPTPNYVYIADGNRVRRLSLGGNMDIHKPSNWQVSLLAGDQSTVVGSAGFADGQGASALFNAPFHLATDSLGNIYVTDTGNNRIRKITPDAVVTTVAGSSSGYQDAQGTQAQFASPKGIAVDKAGFIYISEVANHTIRRIGLDGVVATIAGNPKIAGTSDGSGAGSTFMQPSGVALDSSGSIYVVDTAAHNVRLIQRFIDNP